MHQWQSSLTGLRSGLCSQPYLTSLRATSVQGALSQRSCVLKLFSSLHFPPLLFTALHSSLPFGSHFSQMKLWRIAGLQCRNPCARSPAPRLWFPTYNPCTQLSPDSSCSSRAGIQRGVRRVGEFLFFLPCLPYRCAWPSALSLSSQKNLPKRPSTWTQRVHKRELETETSDPLRLWPETETALRQPWVFKPGPNSSRTASGAAAFLSPSQVLG